MLRIGTKLGIGIGVLLALCVVIGIVSYTQTQVVRRKMLEITEVKEPVNSAVYALENNLVETAFATLGYLSTGDSTLLATLGRNRDLFSLIEHRFNDVADHEKRSDNQEKLWEGFTRLQEVAGAQISLHDLHALKMQQLFQVLDSIDDLLTERIQSSLSVKDPVAYRRLQAVLEMKANVNAIMKGLGNFLLTGDPQFELRIRKARQAFNRYLKVYQYVVLTPREARWSRELRRLSGVSLQLARTIIDLDKQRREKLTEFLAIERDLGTMLYDRIQRRTETNLDQAKLEVLEAGERANRSIMLVLLLSIAFGMLSGLVTTKNITGPIRQLASAMHAIANGDPLRPVVLRSSDELRSLGDAFNLMTGRLLQANEELRGEIAERLRTEKRIRMLAHTITSMNESVMITDLRNTILSVNPAFCAMYRYDAGEVVGRDAGFLELRPTSGPLGASEREKMLAGGWTGELMTTRNRGEGFPVLLSTSVVRDDTGAPIAVVSISRDITEQKLLQQQLEQGERERVVSLRRFAVSVQRAQEEERARISRELHDDLCQRLSGMKFTAEVVADQIGHDNRKAIRQVHDIADELDRAISEVRRISSNLRPSVLDDFGLVVALKILCKEFETFHAIRTMFEIEDSPLGDLDPDVEIALYRIVQEALSNIAKHAKASTVTLRLFHHDSSLRLIIEDDGIGFTGDHTIRALSPGHGLGLISMRERTELLGGTFNIESESAKGTIINVTIPRGPNQQ